MNTRHTWTSIRVQSLFAVISAHHPMLHATHWGRSALHNMHVQTGSKQKRDQYGLFMGLTTLNFTSSVVAQTVHDVMTLRLKFTYYMYFSRTETEHVRPHFSADFPLPFAGVSLKLKSVKQRQCVVVMSLFSLHLFCRKWDQVSPLTLGPSNSILSWAIFHLS